MKQFENTYRRIEGKARSIRVFATRLLASHVAPVIRIPQSFKPIIYALSLEAAELLLLAFAALLTLEAILPGIVSGRLNLALFFAVILILFFLSSRIGAGIGLSFPFTPDKRNPLTWIGISWLAFLLTLSTIRFPYWSIPVIVGGMFVAAHLFWKLLFRSEKI
ncbi:MAG: hypothetical protein HGB34_01400 [Candidatus Moranbacteria bacterium]|nr:hypothetical protein [Candidatus Moranbacteria bacterium]NTW75534.1 hypothetical protein [Candidatus Moranbacteria bacterium]